MYNEITFLRYLGSRYLLNTEVTIDQESMINLQWGPDTIKKI